MTPNLPAPERLAELREKHRPVQKFYGTSRGNTVAVMRCPTCWRGGPEDNCDVADLLALVAALTAGIQAYCDWMGEAGRNWVEWTTELDRRYDAMKALAHPPAAAPAEPRHP